MLVHPHCVLSISSLVNCVYQMKTVGLYGDFSAVLAKFDVIWTCFTLFQYQKLLLLCENRC